MKVCKNVSVHDDEQKKKRQTRYKTPYLSTYILLSPYVHVRHVQLGSDLI